MVQIYIVPGNFINSKVTLTNKENKKEILPQNKTNTNISTTSNLSITNNANLSTISSKPTEKIVNNELSNKSMLLILIKKSVISEVKDEKKRQ